LVSIPSPFYCCAPTWHLTCLVIFFLDFSFFFIVHWNCSSNAFGCLLQNILINNVQHIKMGKLVKTTWHLKILVVNDIPMWLHQKSPNQLKARKFAIKLHIYFMNHTRCSCLMLAFNSFARYYEDYFILNDANITL